MMHFNEIASLCVQGFTNTDRQELVRTHLWKKGGNHLSYFPQFLEKRISVWVLQLAGISANIESLNLTSLRSNKNTIYIVTDTSKQMRRLILFVSVQIWGFKISAKVWSCKMVFLIGKLFETNRCVNNGSVCIWKSGFRQQYFTRQMKKAIIGVLQVIAT